MKKLAILLSGCGVFDGSEINEAVLTMLSISQFGAEYSCFAPNMIQSHVINHLTGKEVNESRNVLVESARIARGEIKAISELTINEFDALVIPGGFGAAKNLCNFAFDSANCALNPEVANFINSFINAKKPVGFICISPIMIPLLYGQSAKGTIGNEPETIKAFEMMGGCHITTNVDEIAVDESRKIVSTPAYMLAQNISETYNGINKLVAKVIDMA